MGINQKLIKTIVHRILSASQPVQIILFGSAITGQMNKDSDIDLLVLEDKSTDILKERVRIGNALRGLGYPFDVIVMEKERFEESKNVIGGIAYPANKNGKVIYEIA